MVSHAIPAAVAADAPAGRGPSTLGEPPSLYLYYTARGTALRPLDTVRTWGSCRDRPPHERYRRQQPRAPVLGLADLQTGVEHRFSRLGAGPEQHVAIGSSPHCDIVLGDSRVAPEACVIHVTPHAATVLASLGARGAVTVNGIPLRPGPGLELVQGAILRVGRSALVALGEPADPAPPIGARSLDEFILASLRVHGSVRAAALALGIARSTFHDRVKRALAAHRAREDE